MLYSGKYTKRETIQSKKSLMVDKIFSGNTIYNRKVLCKVKYYERKYSPGKKKYEVIIRIYICLHHRQLKYYCQAAPRGNPFLLSRYSINICVFYAAAVTSSKQLPQHRQ